MMDPEGFVFIVDRLKDMIVTGGENVYSAVENAISMMPKVAEFAVIGIPDETWGETVQAFVVAPRRSCRSAKADSRTSSVRAASNSAANHYRFPPQAKS